MPQRARDDVQCDAQVIEARRDSAPGAMPATPCNETRVALELVTILGLFDVLLTIGQAAVLAAVQRRQHLSRSQIIEADARPRSFAERAGEDWTRLGIRAPATTFSQQLAQ